jgi:hypothetical protein
MHCISEQVYSSGDSSNLYSGGAHFESRLSWLNCLMVFLSPLKKIPGYYLKLEHDRFLPHPFQFIIHYHAIIWRYIAWVTDIVVK